MAVIWYEPGGGLNSEYFQYGKYLTEYKADLLVTEYGVTNIIVGDKQMIVWFGIYTRNAPATKQQSKVG
jgi:hypothetical protein